MFERGGPGGRATRSPSMRPPAGSPRRVATLRSPPPCARPAFTMDLAVTAVRSSVSAGRWPP